jgi:hypothetical protein
MQLPIYHFKNFAQLPDMGLSSLVVNQHDHTTYTNSNNFPIDLTRTDLKAFLDTLYDQVLIKAQGIFGPFTLADDNSRQPWAYVTNLAHYLGGIHEHKQTSTINAVYYMWMPRTKEERHGAICFYDDALVETYCLKPATGDLVIFPNYLLHQPLACPTFDHRVSINLEIKTKEPLFG